MVGLRRVDSRGSAEQSAERFAGHERTKRLGFDERVVGQPAIATGGQRYGRKYMKGDSAVPSVRGERRPSLD
jgi:hypothetical protein